MKDKYWYAHVDAVIDRSTHSVVEQWLKKEHPRRARRAGFGQSTFDYTPTDIVAELQQSLGKVFQPTEETIKKEDVMEDNEDLKAIDYMVGKLMSSTRSMDRSVYKDLSQPVARERKLFDLGMIFLESAEYGDTSWSKLYIDEGGPVNFQHPSSKLTALHIAAAEGNQNLSDLLVNSEQCDYLLKESRGYIAFDLAYRFGHCSELTHELELKTIEQAEKDGITDFKLDYGVDMSIFDQFTND